MSFENVAEYLRERGYSERIRLFDVSSATVALAAKALGCEEALIAKSIAFKSPGGAIILVTAGDTKINSGAFKRCFGFKPSMTGPDETERITGHKRGGVCPFALPEGVDVYLDESLKRFETVYPAAGSSNSAVSLSPDELYEISGSKAWVQAAQIIKEKEESLLYCVDNRQNG